MNNREQGNQRQPDIAPILQRVEDSYRALAGDYALNTLTPRFIKHFNIQDRLALPNAANEVFSRLFAANVLDYAAEQRNDIAPVTNIPELPSPTSEEMAQMSDAVLNTSAMIERGGAELLRFEANELVDKAKPGDFGVWEGKELAAMAHAFGCMYKNIAGDEMGWAQLLRTVHDAKTRRESRKQNIEPGLEKTLARTQDKLDNLLQKHFTIITPYVDTLYCKRDVREINLHFLYTHQSIHRWQIPLHPIHPGMRLMMG